MLLLKSQNGLSNHTNELFFRILFPKLISYFPYLKMLINCDRKYSSDLLHDVFWLHLSFSHTTVTFSMKG